MDEIPEPIRVAISRLTGVPGVVLESGPEFIQAESSWKTRLRLTSASSDFVPTKTNWDVLVDDSYPAGRIRFYPSQDGGLIYTFPHQERNVETKSMHPVWRSGKACLDSPSQRLGRIAGGPEPKGDREQRLRWHVERCLAWLHVAATDQLMVAGEPFEVPWSPCELLDTRLTVIHDEGEDTWGDWEGYFGHYGEVQWASMPGFEKTIAAEAFLDARGKQIRRCRRRFEPGDQPWIGYWWLWPSPVVVPPWHAPGTWADLRRAGARHKVDVDEFLRWLADRAGGKPTVLILLGYPIPSLWNGVPVEVHWQTILAPHIPSPIEPLNGYRADKGGRRLRLQRDIFRGGKNLSYLKTANWHPNRLQARGRFPSKLASQSVAVLGAGALGSSIAELLARGGVTRMLIVDHDDLEAGNLVRHTLTGADLGLNKATAVAERLQSAAPMSLITSHAASLPKVDELQALLQPFDVVLDCTGDDDALRRLGMSWWSVPRYFLSVSLGFAANRLFLFGAHGCTFPFDEFELELRPWLAKERSQWAAEGETLEGAGCWAPLFPARSDDVWLAAVAAVRNLERAQVGRVADGLCVLEQSTGQGFTGYRPVDLEDLS